MASGKSKRMGTNKLLLEYRGMTFIENTLKKVLNENFYELAIVICDKKVRKKCQDYIKKSEKDEKKIYIVDNKILCISREGVATYINCYLEKSLNKNIENTINKGFPFPQVVEEKSFTFRYSIEPEENYIYLKRIS